MTGQLEFYDLEGDCKVLLRFNIKGNQITVYREMLGNKEPRLEGANYTDRYTFKEQGDVERIIPECQHLECVIELTQLFKKYSYEFEQLSVEV